MSSSRVPVLSPNAPPPSPLMSQALTHNGTIYCSGSLGIDPKTGKFVSGDASDRTVRERSRAHPVAVRVHPTNANARHTIQIQALRNLEQLLIAGGSGLDKVLKVTIFLSSMEHYAKVNEGYARVFTHDIKPCRTCVGVASLPLDAEVEIELVASV
ncbi:uncharacterized protein DSM5745_04583 [Aspergillus mulundensis]|uniref:Uncharacterized protein n=1 Tax=Aspergillus mulundensis TaxID=1810919 RepID=A0A3D8S448_9EURO|nr:Uncharacterized protein DSM5745_04583 [Aspergillus mulundensis]RDW81026.1 Uncharacterized protein DSM5745_04583 [Aspergillus mulundensis]